MGKLMGPGLSFLICEMGMPTVPLTRIAGVKWEQRCMAFAMTVRLIPPALGSEGGWPHSCLPCFTDEVLAFKVTWPTHAEAELLAF